jgi:hypothetical protein
MIPKKGLSEPVLSAIVSPIEYRSPQYDIRRKNFDVRSLWTNTSTQQHPTTIGRHGENEKKKEKNNNNKIKVTRA